MASVRKRTDGQWRARYRDTAGKEHAQHFARKVDAQRWIDEITTALLTGQYVDPKAGRVTVKEYAEQRWVPSLVHVRPASLELYRGHLRNHVLPAFGGRPIGTLRRTDCKTFVAALAARLAPSTVGTVYAVLRMVMQAAVDDGLVPSNPCSRVPLPRVERSVLEPMPAQTVVALASAVPARYSVTVWLAAGAGLRQGEALGLTAARVDFLRRRIFVEEQVQGLSGCEPTLVPLKTPSSRRVVPVDEVVLEAVTTHMRGWQQGPGGLLVTNRLGRPVRRSSFGDCWRDAVEAVGAPAGTRFHELRHFYASTLIHAGLHPKEIQVRLGHASITETMDTYGHLFPDSEESGRGAIQGALGEILADSLRTEAILN
jgi:integrase